MNAPRRRIEGITLMEAMIAITILTMVTTLVWGGFSQTARNKARVEADLGRMQEVRITLNRMVRELGQAYVSAQRNPNTILRTTVTAFIGLDHGDRDRIDFTSFSHRRLRRDAHESDQCELSYFVADDPDPDNRGQRVLARREQNRIDDDPQRGGHVQILAHDVVGFELEYLDPASGEWLRSWDTTQAAQQPNRLPSQVKILLTMRDPRHHGRTLTYGTRAELRLVWALNHSIYNP
ncbi:MAG: general secretion pathway protein GspJ [Deltaproteobacteria bacterium]|nr:general secretion pathway protein GspJ [Deltaproteobacteria bacterium]